MKKSAICYIFSIGLIIMYIFTLSLKFFPKVPIEYELYYLDNKLQDWPGYNKINVKINEKTKFYGEDIGKNKGVGWSYPEEWGTWTDGQEATLYYGTKNLKNINGNLKFSIKINGEYPYDQLDIFINDNKIKKQDINFEDNIVSFSVKKEYFYNNKAIEVKFKFNNIKSPYEKGISEDTRKLGLPVIWTEFTLV